MNTQQVEITTGGDSSTFYFDSTGQQIWPCRCGQTHKGDYGLYDYLHHNCHHHEFWKLDEDLPNSLICAACGKGAEIVGEGS